MDLVWLKRGDVRMHDHGPMAAAIASGRAWAALFVYEPDQLAHHSVHGSHVEFCNEGLRDFDARLRGLAASRRDGAAAGATGLSTRRGEITAVLAQLHGTRPLLRLLAHEETGHLVSYARDKRVRRWCRANGVAFVEFAQTGATRALPKRDDFTARYNAFMSRPQHRAPSAAVDVARLHTLPASVGVCGAAQLARWAAAEREEREEEEGEGEGGVGLAMAHAADRADRQRGGETRALELLASFLDERGEGYNRGISSPALAWSSCSRLSAHLTFGHLSLRRLVHALTARQQQLRKRGGKTASGSGGGGSGGGSGSGGGDGDWPRSLSSFHSRLRWRAHFIQKLESEPHIEQHAQARAYDALRTAPGDWNAAHYEAWAAGRTGFPLVDACMRCLERHGWLNFRMRAMVVSFACYNLWLDWRRIAPHLARCFLDYEPGIHYPQLQMQAGVTGINALRVYNVSKQAREQDPDGSFIRTHVPELRRVPDRYVHEPWRMPRCAQRECGVRVGSAAAAAAAAEVACGGVAGEGDGSGVLFYPSPVVDAEAAARVAKERISAVHKTIEARSQARQVYEKHGSRKGQPGAPRSDFARQQEAARAKDKPAKRALPAGQTTLVTHMLTGAAIVGNCVGGDSSSGSGSCSGSGSGSGSGSSGSNAQKRRRLGDGGGTAKQGCSGAAGQWTCETCTLLNTRAEFLACEACGSERDKR